MHSFIEYSFEKKINADLISSTARNSMFFFAAVTCVTTTTATTANINISLTDMMTNRDDRHIRNVLGHHIPLLISVV